MSTRWWVMLPGEAHAVHFDFEVPVSEAHARAYVRHWLGVKRLPNGTQVWRG